MRNKYYTMCTVIQNDDGSKFISDLKDKFRYTYF